jgi:hypothetical protein
LLPFQLAPAVHKVTLAPAVHKVLQEILVLVVLQEHKDNEAYKAFQDKLEVKVPQDSRAIKAFLVMMVLRVLREVRAPGVLMVLKAIQEKLVQEVRKEIKVYRAMTAQSKDLKGTLEHKVSVSHYKELKPQ